MYVQRCSSHGDEETPAIDGSEILEGDYENETAGSSIVEMTHSCEREKSDERSSHMPRSVCTISEDATSFAPPEEEMNGTTAATLV